MLISSSLPIAFNYLKTYIAYPFDNNEFSEKKLIIMTQYFRFVALTLLNVVYL